MEVYILDSLYRRVDVVDRFESLIWTERFSAYGDFQLDLHSTFSSRTRFPVGTRLAINESYRVMTVETIEDSTDTQGKATLKLTGRSLETVLDDRIARAALSDTTTAPKWTLTGTPTAILRKLFHDICVTGVLDPADKIPGVIESSIFPTDTIAEPSETITYEINPQSLYKAIKDLADLYGIGFRLVRNFDNPQLYFDFYMGSDRTTQQSTLAAVVFSPDLDNLQNPKELTSVAVYKNVAYVISPVGNQVVYAQDVSPTTTGFERRVLLVNAADIKDTDPAIASAKMIQKGKEELAKFRQFSAFDGELSQYSSYRYGTHYNLGDLVELRNIDGVTNQMQVTEQIFVSDKEGDRAYPTLAINKFITPGSWSAWDYNQVWQDLDPSLTAWVDQP